MPTQPPPTAGTSTTSEQSSDMVSTSELSSQYPAGNKFFLSFFMAVFLFSLYLLYEVMLPFLHSIILACVLTALCYPLYKKCLAIVKRPVFASLLVLAGLTFLVVLPITVFIVGLIPQAAQSFATINEWLTGAHLGEVINNYINPLLTYLQEQIPSLDVSSLNLQDSALRASREAGQLMLGFGTYLLSNTLKFIIHFGLILLIMFFLLLDGVRLTHRLTYYFPLKPAQTTIIIEGLRKMSRAVLIGGFAVAGLQGIVGGIGFAIVGISPLFWGTVMIFAALVPVIGTGLVWLPAVLVLLLRGEMGSAIFLSIWCGVGVTSIDSFLRPILVRGGANVPILFIFLSILGGINVFGMLGLLYGPMILGFVALMLDIYDEEYHSILQSRTQQPASDCVEK